MTRSAPHPEHTPHPEPATHPAPAPRHPRAARGGIGWRLAVVGVLALAAAVGLWWYGDRHREFDLKIYFHAIRWWSHGHPLYDFAQPDRVQGVLGYTYPPFAAVLMYPMAWLPLGAVIAINWVASGLALLITTVWLVGPVAARHGWPRWFAVSLAVPLFAVLEPIRENATFGQINMYLVLLILVDLLFLLPRGSRWAGVGIGVATAIKLTPGIFIVYLLVTRRYRAAITAAGSTALACGLALALAPHTSWRYWTHTLWQTGHIGHLYFVSNQSLMGMLARFFRPHPANGALWLALVLLAGGYGMWRAARAGRQGDELAGLTLTGLVGCLVSPVSWQHHLYWFAPALLMLLDAATTRGVRARPWYAALGVLSWATVTISVISFFDYHWVSRSSLDSPVGVLVSNWYTMVMLVLVVALPIGRRAATAADPVAADPHVAYSTFPG